MTVTVLIGEDDVSAQNKKYELLGDNGYETVDCLEGVSPIIDALSSPSLFGGVRKIWAVNADAITLNEAEIIAKATLDSKASVVLRAEKMDIKTRNCFKSFAQIFTFSTLKGRALSNKISEMIKDSEISLNAEARKVLIDRVGQDIERLQSILSQCKIAGMSTPTAAQISVLVGSAKINPKPWDLTDALEEGDDLKVLEISQNLLPIATIAYLSNRYTTLIKINESSDEDELSEALGKTSPFQVERLKRSAAVIGSDKLHRALSILTKADSSIKYSKFPESVFDSTMLELSETFKS